MNINNFDTGLILGPSLDKLPEGSCFRYRGIHPLSLGSVRSRDGSSLLFDLDAHSIFYFGDVYFSGVSTKLYRAAASIKTGLNGNRLSFSKMPPTAGIPDYLFVAGGGELFKSDSSGNVTDWGFLPPVSGFFNVTATNPVYISIRSATYKWTLSALGTDEYYCELAAGGDPSLPTPTNVLENSISIAFGALSSLPVPGYGYGDNDTLGYNTIYVRLTDGTDPDTKAAGYVQYTASTDLLTNGTYQYKITYKNSTTGHRSNGSTTVSATTFFQYNVITGMPDGSGIDSQIDKIEIWRTVVDGNAFFLLTEIDTGTGTYTDDGTDSLSSVELPTDNLQPFDYLTKCFGPHNASMFWITSSQSGQRGRVFYSPIGRAESIQGFVEVSSDDDPIQTITAFQTQLCAFSESGIFLINGTNPYISRRIKGCPGTTNPDSVVPTPNGIFYEASDGIRLFNGTQSTIVKPGSVERIFRGESRGDLTSFTSTVAAYCRDEYIITDGSQSIAFDTGRNRWRDLGVGFNAIFYNKETKQIATTLSSEMVEYEKEGILKDNNSSFPISLEFPHFKPDDHKSSILQYIILDILTTSVIYTITLIHDNTETVIGKVQSASRSLIEIPIGITANKIGIRIEGNCTAPFELHEIIIEKHIPKGLDNG